jgi:dTDP-4-dehydrorhamnose 3,5-epimerase
MFFSETELKDAILIRPDRKSDARGYFARTLCQTEFQQHGLKTVFVQGNVAYSRLAGTLRGMHFQRVPHTEAKLVQCVGGAVYDVIVDLRGSSPSYRKWQGFELSAENGNSLYVPEGFAHGYITLVDDASVSYLVTSSYTPTAEGGIRYDDPAIGIKWPATPDIVSDRDRIWPALSSDQHCFD